MPSVGAGTGWWADCTCKEVCLAFGTSRGSVSTVTSRTAPPVCFDAPPGSRSWPDNLGHRGRGGIAWTDEPARPTTSQHHRIRGARRVRDLQRRAVSRRGRDPPGESCGGTGRAAQVHLCVTRRGHRRPEELPVGGAAGRCSPRLPARGRGSGTGGRRNGTSRSIRGGRSLCAAARRFGGLGRSAFGGGVPGRGPGGRQSTRRSGRGGSGRGGLVGEEHHGAGPPGGSVAVARLGGDRRPPAGVGSDGARLRDLLGLPAGVSDRRSHRPWGLRRLPVSGPLGAGARCDTDRVPGTDGRQDLRLRRLPRRMPTRGTPPRIGGGSAVRPGGLDVDAHCPRSGIAGTLRPFLHPAARPGLPASQRPRGGRQYRPGCLSPHRRTVPPAPELDSSGSCRVDVGRTGRRASRSGSRLARKERRPEVLEELQLAGITS